MCQKLTYPTINTSRHRINTNKSDVLGYGTYVRITDLLPSHFIGEEYKYIKLKDHGCTAIILGDKIPVLESNKIRDNIATLGERYICQIL